MNEFIVQPEIGSFANLKGRTVIVDAPPRRCRRAKKILLKHGLQEDTSGRWARSSTARAARAAFSNLPIEAEEHGSKSRGPLIELLGPYQRPAPWRRVLGHRPDTVERDLAVCAVTALVCDPANKSECLALLRGKLKLWDATAARTLVNPGFGFTPGKVRRAWFPQICSTGTPRSSARRAPRRFDTAKSEPASRSR